MFKYKIYGKEDKASRATLLCATDYRDVAVFIRDNIAKAFDADKHTTITMSETKDAEFFSRMQREEPAQTEDANADD